MSHLVLIYYKRQLTLPYFHLYFSVSTSILSSFNCLLCILMISFYSLHHLGFSVCVSFWWKWIRKGDWWDWITQLPKYIWSFFSWSDDIPLLLQDWIATAETTTREPLKMHTGLYKVERDTGEANEVRKKHISQVSRMLLNYSTFLAIIFAIIFSPCIAVKLLVILSFFHFYCWGLMICFELI